MRSKIIQSLLRRNFSITQNDINLHIFPSPPRVAFRQKKIIGNIIVKNDVRIHEPRNTQTRPCGANCKLCSNLTTSSKISYRGITYKCKAGDNYKTKNVVYTARYKNHDLLYIGHTGETLSHRFAKHRYDFKKPPEYSELADHFYNGHSLDDLQLIIHEFTFAKETRTSGAVSWLCCLMFKQRFGRLRQGIVPRVHWRYRSTFHCIFFCLSVSCNVYVIFIWLRMIKVWANILTYSKFFLRFFQKFANLAEKTFA